MTARGNRYLTVIPAPLDRSKSIVSPGLNSSCMASQQAFDQAVPLGILRQSSSELIRTSNSSAVCGAAQLGEQFIFKVIGRNHWWPPAHHAPNPSRKRANSGVRAAVVRLTFVATIQQALGSQQAVARLK